MGPGDRPGTPRLERVRAGADEVGVEPCVVLRLASGRYALPMAEVVEVGRLPPLTRLPGTPSFLAGLVNWRGAALAVLDVDPVLSAGLPGPVAPTRAGASGAGAGRLVVLAELGLRVEEVAGTVEIDLAGLADPPAHLHGDARALLRGVAVQGTEALAVLDSRALGGLSARLAGGQAGL